MTENKKEGGVDMFTKEELELLELIRNSDNPQMALYVALGIISDAVKNDVTQKS